MKSSYLVQFLRAKSLGVYNRLRVRAGRLPEMDSALMTMLPSNEAKADLYLRDAIGRLHRLASGLDFRAVFILLPDRHQVSGRRLAEAVRYYGIGEKVDPDLPARLTERVLDDFGIPHVDLAGCLREFPEPDELYLCPGRPLDDRRSYGGRPVPGRDSSSSFGCCRRKNRYPAKRLAVPRLTIQRARVLGVEAKTLP